MRYRLQNRYQDSGYEDLPKEQFNELYTARKRAAKLAKNAIFYGMVRIIDSTNNTVCGEYAAGGHKIL